MAAVPFSMVAVQAVAEAACDRMRAWGRWAGRFVRREPLPERPLVAVAAALAGGCGLTAVVEIPPIGWWLAALGAIGGWALLARQGRTAWAGLALLAAVAGGGAGWCVVRAAYFSADDLAWGLRTFPQPVAIEGMVLESPRRLSTPQLDPLRSEAAQAAMQRPSSECVVDVQAVRRGGSWRPASGRAALVVDGDPPDLVAGCRVRVLGRGMRPPPPLNPDEFDFSQRARSLRCLSVVRADSAACVRVLRRPSAWAVAAWIDRLRTRGVEVLRTHLPPERAALAAALLLGSREALPREESLEFLVTGTIHILSISGLHVGFLAVALFTVLRMLSLPRAWSLAAVICCTGLYMLLVRAETPVVRATLLIWLACLGAAVGRRSLAANSLAVSAILLLLWHPPELFRIGSQLSFLSTAVLIGASAALRRPATDDPIERLIDRSRTPWERRLRRLGRHVLEGVVAGAAVWVVTAPVVAARFHLVSPVALVLNPVIAPLVAIAMAWGLLCLMAATVSSSLAAACGWACDGTLRCIGWSVAQAAAMPGGYAWVPGPPGWWVAGWYAGLIAVMLLAARERLARIGTWVTVAAVWAFVGIVGVGAERLLCPQQPAVEVVVAAMGHGCGIVVRSPTGRCLVYDAGRLGAASAARRAMTAVLWNEGVSRIDTLVISHADADHFNAVPELLERFSVGELLVSPAFLASESWAAREVLRRAAAAGIPVRTAQAGDSFAVDSLCRVRVLHPSPGIPGPGGAVAASDNETSLVMVVESAGRRLLLTGDLEGDALARFVASGPDGCDVLVAPHHGSRTSLPPEIARATRADWVVVSGAGSAGWPEVREAYATAAGGGRRATVVSTGVGKPGSDDASTAEDSPGGAISLTLTAGEVVVRQFVAGRWRSVQPQARPAAGPAEPASPSAYVGSGRVSHQPAAISSNWLATNPASSISTPLVKP